MATTLPDDAGISAVPGKGGTLDAIGDFLSAPPSSELDPVSSHCATGSNTEGTTFDELEQEHQIDFASGSSGSQAKKGTKQTSDEGDGEGKGSGVKCWRSGANAKQDRQRGRYWQVN